MSPSRTSTPRSRPAPAGKTQRPAQRPLQGVAVDHAVAQQVKLPAFMGWVHPKNSSSSASAIRCQSGQCTDDTCAWGASRAPARCPRRQQASASSPLAHADQRLLDEGDGNGALSAAERSRASRNDVWGYGRVGTCGELAPGALRQDRDAPSRPFCRACNMANSTIHIDRFRHGSQPACA